MLNELIDLYGTCKTDELHCDVSKNLKSNSAWVKIPFAKSQSRVASCQVNHKSAAAEALALKEMIHVRHLA